MSIALITGSAGLIGAEACRLFAAEGLDVVGVDNDLRSYFFGPEASTRRSRERLVEELPTYRHHDLDVRDEEGLAALFERYGGEIAVVAHTAAQPSHDWAAKEPLTDFDVNARATLLLLEATRRHSPEAVFLFTSTNKVYGDAVNRLPRVELETRWELDPEHRWAAEGVDESMPLDGSLHSLFGASKVAADVLVQEYGRYFGMRTACFRGGCLTGPGHAGAELHGFLAYLVRCAVEGRTYRVLGYGGKQVRDNIHAHDLVAAFREFFHRPRSGEAYNIGGGRFANCSILEAIALCEELLGRPVRWEYEEENRRGDHVWWISDNGKFRSHYPEWRLTYGIRDTVEEIVEEASRRHGGAG